MRECVRAGYVMEEENKENDGEEEREDEITRGI